MNRFTLGAVALLIASPALALDFGNGFSVVGEVSVENIDTPSEHALLAFGDVTLSWRNQPSGGLGFGADLTVDAVRVIDDGDTFSNVWGGLVLTTGFGEFTVGVPRPILEKMIVTPEIGGSGIVALEIGAFGGASSFFSTILKIDDDVQEIYGVSYIGQSGGFEYGAAVHSVESDVTVIELAARYSVGQSVFYAGFEDIGTTEGIQLLTLGAEYESDRWMVGVQARQYSEGSDNGTSYLVFGSYDVTPELSIGAQALSVSDSSSDLYGINAAYELPNGLFGGLGYVSETDGDSDILSAEVGFRF